MVGTVVAVCTSERKGERKQPAASVRLRWDHGIPGDAHAGGGHRQVSLLGVESVRKMRERGLDVGSGDFAENITTCGIDLPALSAGVRLSVGDAMLEVTQIGKECHSPCAIYRQVGDCVMPKEGIFARVINGGTVRPGDRIAVVTRGG